MRQFPVVQCIYKIWNFHWSNNSANLLTMMGRVTPILFVSLSLTKTVITQVVDCETDSRYYEGDLIVTGFQQRPDISPNLWSTDINYALLYSLSSGEKRTAMEAGMQHLEDSTCITFTERQAKPLINFYESAIVCRSYVGYVYDSQYLAILSGCESLGYVVHQIGHNLGLLHEQSRSDRDTYIDIISDNIANDSLGQFDKRTVPDIGNLPYDYSSNMHYGLTYFSKNGLPTILPKQDPLATVFIGSRNGLSFYDIKRINLLYSCIDAWNSTCSTSSQPCMNDGYYGENCTCVCRPGTSGDNCEKEDMGYYEALLAQEGSGLKTSTITTASQLISDDGAQVQKHSYLIRAPECHNVVLDITSVNMVGRVNTRHADSVCYHEYLHIRKDLNTTEISSVCEDGESSTLSFTSAAQEMVLDTKLLPDSNSNWSATVSFSRYCVSDVVLEYTNTSDCQFVEEGSNYFYRNPNYPYSDSPGFNCSLEFGSSEMAFYTLTAARPETRKLKIKFMTRRNRFRNYGPNRAPKTLPLSQGKLIVWYKPSKKNQENITFNIKIEPKPFEEIIQLVDGQVEKFVYNSSLGTESTAYKFEAPEGKRIKIEFTQFNLGNATGKRCAESNFLLIGKFEPDNKRRLNKFCNPSRDATSEERQSDGNTMYLYVIRKNDVQESFEANVEVIE